MSAGIRELLPRGQKIVGTVVPATGASFPKDAVVHVSIEDTSRQDAPAETIREVRVPAEGRSAVSFEVSFDPGKLDQRRDYTLQVLVTRHDDVLYLNTKTLPLRDIDRSRPIEITVDRIAP